MKDRISLGVIGAGRIGRLHAENLTYRIPEATVLAVSDIRLEAAKECAAALGIPEAVEDYRAVLDNADIDAVAICSSTDTHARIIAAAAEAGKNIFCEKPVALDLGLIDQALERVAACGVKLQIGFNRRFDPNFLRIRELVSAGRIGKPHLLRITSRDPSPPPIDYIKISGGIFLDMMIHDFDMARFLVGAEVEEVYAMGGVNIDPAIGEAGDIDTALVTLRFENGVLGSIDNSRQAVYGYDQRVEVFGALGMVTTENNTPNRTRLSTAEAVMEELPLHFFVERHTEAYINEMKAFVACLAEDRDPPVSGADGRAPVVMGLAADLSYREKRPVRLEEIG